MSTWSRTHPQNGYWFLNTNVKYGFSVIGEQGYIETSWRGAYFSCTALSITTPRLKWEEWEKRTNGRHMRQKRAVTTHPLFGAKCWKLYKYATLTVKHIAEQSFICEPHKSWFNVNSNTALYTVSALVRGGKALEHMAALNRSLDHFTCPQRVPGLCSSQNVRFWLKLQEKHERLQEFNLSLKTVTGREYK